MSNLVEPEVIDLDGQFSSADDSIAGGGPVNIVPVYDEDQTGDLVVYNAGRSSLLEARTPKDKTHSVKVGRAEAYQGIVASRRQEIRDMMRHGPPGPGEIDMEVPIDPTDFIDSSYINGGEYDHVGEDEIEAALREFTKSSTGEFEDVGEFDEDEIEDHKEFCKGHKQLFRHPKGAARGVAYWRKRRSTTQKHMAVMAKQRWQKRFDVTKYKSNKKFVKRSYKKAFKKPYKRANKNYFKKVDKKYVKPSVKKTFRKYAKKQVNNFYYSRR